MDDAQIIAHQARKIAELEMAVDRHREGERQLLAMLQRAGIVVAEVELSPDEVEFLEYFRRASPEGKAQIWSEVEAQVAATKQRAQVVEAKPASRPKKSLKTSSTEVVPSLPADFFKRTLEADTHDD
jgi:hypothetical protein